MLSVVLKNDRILVPENLKSKKLLLTKAFIASSIKPVLISKEVF
jgi:hypothetical protein